MGVDLSLKIKKRFPASQFEFVTCSEESALNQVSRGEATLALTTGDLGSHRDLIAKQIEETEFQIFIGEKHPLYNKASAKKVIPISEILEHIFVVPDSALLGQVGPKQAMDGWRDDQFPRKIDFRISGLNILEQLLISGKVLAYLPSYFCKTLPVVSAKIGGCPYSCAQKVKLVSRKQSEGIWLNQFL
jgi:DNA-binding transcriptional LysR family regulator